MTDPTAVMTKAAVPQLVVRGIGDRPYTAHPRNGKFFVARDDAGQLKIAANGAQAVAEVKPVGLHWRVLAPEAGAYLDGQRRHEIDIVGEATIALGEPTGATVTFQELSPRGVDPSEDLERTSIDILRAGQAVAARREAMGLSQRQLAVEKVMNAGALIQFEKGRSWPHEETRSKLEERLGMAPGEIARYREGLVESGAAGAAPAAEATNTVQASLMAETVELSMSTITAGIEALPQTSDPEFTPRANGLLGDLRRLESLCSKAARDAKGAPAVAVVLSKVRRAYRELMDRAAQSPNATLGQQLFAMRATTGLSVEETANAAGVSTDAVAAAEAEKPLSSEDLTALTLLLEHMRA
ncbi:FHA domain-containing protein [Mycobacteroides abscessus subsp. abscessus]|nr:FHA domain-containing protein [Mycobacteroides abscessus subsp. abscessus]